MNEIVHSKMNYYLKTHGQSSIDELVFHEIITDSLECIKVKDSSVFDIEDYVFNAFYSNNPVMIDGLKEILGQLVFNMCIKNSFDVIFNGYHFINEKTDSTVKDDLVVQVFADLVKDSEKFALEQITDLSGNSFLVESIKVRPLFELLLDHYGEKDFFKNLLGKKIKGPYINQIMSVKKSEAEKGQMFLTIKEYAPNLLENVRIYFKNNGLWKPDLYKDSVLLYFLMDRDIEEKEMRQDLNQTSIVKRKAVKF